MRRAAALLGLALLSCASVHPGDEARAWTSGSPLPAALLRFEGWPAGSCFPGPLSTLTLYGELENYPLLLAILLAPETDGRVFEYAVERALLAGGPSRLFRDLAERYAARPELLLRDRHRLLERRGRLPHVRIDALWLRDEDLAPPRQQEVGLRMIADLEDGAPWTEILRRPAVGNFGDFVLSAAKQDARPFRDIRVARKDIDVLLSLRARGSLIRRDEAEKRTYVYWITDLHPGWKVPEAPVYPEKNRLLIRVDEKGEEHAVASVGDWARRRGHILANMEKVMGPLPEVFGRGDLFAGQDVDTQEEKAYFLRRIEFLSGDGDLVPAYLFIPKGLQGRAPAVLCLHQTTPLGKKEPAGMGNRNLAYAKELAERGFVTLAPDYPNFGDYKADPYAMGYASATMKGIWNHRRAVDLLQALPEVDPERIGAIGHSLGGHNAIFAAAFDDRIKAVVSSCGFNAFPKYYGGNLGGWSHKGYMPRIAELYGKDPKRVPFDFTEVVAALAPRPFFINAPLKDANFEVSGVKDVVDAARPVYALLGAAEALVAVHPDVGHDFPPEIRRAAYAFLEKALGPR